jgi:hypothetical protein
MTGIHHSDDSSLQAWGRGLKTIGPALQEIHKQHEAAHQATVAATEAVTKIANQAQSDLPVSRALAAEADSIAAGLRSVQADEEALAKRRAALIGRAEALPGTYNKEHETDEDRLTAPRVSRAAEKRADVGAAEQDT